MLACGYLAGFSCTEGGNSENGTLFDNWRCLVWLHLQYACSIGSGVLNKIEGELAPVAELRLEE